MLKSLLAGKFLLTAAAIAILAPGFASANSAGVIHVPSGRLYVLSGTGTPVELRQQALSACLTQEGINPADTKAARNCMFMLNEPYGACDSTYGKGFQAVTVGGIKWQGPRPGYTGFLSCGKTQADSDANFHRHCANQACSIWQHYTDADNK